MPLQKLENCSSLLGIIGVHLGSELVTLGSELSEAGSSPNTSTVTLLAPLLAGNPAGR